MSGSIHISSRTTFGVNMLLPRQHTSHWKAASCNNLLDIVHVQIILKSNPAYNLFWNHCVMVRPSADCCSKLVG